MYLLQSAQEIIIQKDCEINERLILEQFPLQKEIYQEIRRVENLNDLMENKFGLLPVKISRGRYKDFEGNHFIAVSGNMEIGPLKSPVEISKYGKQIPLQYLKKTLDIQNHFQKDCSIYIADINSDAVFAAKRDTVKQTDPLMFCQLYDDKKTTYLIGVWD